MPLYCHSSVPLSLYCHSSVTPLLFSCYSTATPLLLSCYPTATLLPLHSHSTATLVPTLLPLHWNSTGTLLALHCHSPATWDHGNPRTAAVACLAQPEVKESDADPPPTKQIDVASRRRRHVTVTIFPLLGVVQRVRDITESRLVGPRQPTSSLT